MDNSLMAIMVLAMVVWEFIQRATPEKNHREHPSERGATEREAFLESQSFADAKKDCTLLRDNNKE